MRPFVRRARSNRGPRIVPVPALMELTLDPVDAVIGVEFVSDIGNATPGSTITATFGLFSNVVVDREALTITAMPGALGTHAGVLTETLAGSPNSPRETRIVPMQVLPTPPAEAPLWRQQLWINGDIAIGGAPFSDFHLVLTAASVTGLIFDPVEGAQDDGADIWLSVDPEGNERLPVDLAFWDKAAGVMCLWLTIPRLARGEFPNHYLWWGGAQTPVLAPDAPFGRNAVWADEWCVHHFNEATGPFVDSTGGGADIPPGSSITRGMGPLGGRAITDGGFSPGEAPFVANLQPGSRPYRVSVMATIPVTPNATRFGYGIPSNAVPTQGVFGIACSEGSTLRPVVRLDRAGAEVRILGGFGGPSIVGEPPTWLTEAFDRTLASNRLRAFVGDSGPTIGNLAENNPVWPTTRGLCISNPNAGFACTLDMAIIGPDRGDPRWYIAEHDAFTDPGFAVFGGEVDQIVSTRFLP